MAAKITYKKLCQVHVLHEYFLLGRNESTFFGLGREAREDRIQKMLYHDTYDMRRQLSIVPTAKTEKLLDEYHIRFIPTALGFFLGIEVKPETQPGGTVRYRPKLEIEEDFRITFLLKVKDTLWFNYSEGRLANPEQKQYFFTNQAFQGEQSPFPYLTQLPTLRPTSSLSQMGDIARDGEGFIRATVDRPGPRDWERLADGGYANESDRMLYPSRFSVAWPPTPNPPSNPRVALHAPNGALLVGPISVDLDAQRLTNPVSFQPEIPIDTPVEKRPFKQPQLEAGAYQLRLLDGNRVVATRSIYIDDDAWQPKSIGAISISLGRGETPSNLLNEDGFLQIQKQGASVLVPEPQFELRFLSRLLYWRIETPMPLSEADRILQSTNETFRWPFNNNVRALMSRRPYPLSTQARQFSIDANAGGQRQFWLPAPPPSPLGRFRDEEVQGLTYGNLYLPATDQLFFG